MTIDAKLLSLFLVLLLVCPGMQIPLGELPEKTDQASYIWRYGGPYGHYCGIFHTDKTFREPIDNVDRACQLHDTCISSAGHYLDCPCNEQLLLRMYESCPNSTDAVYYRDQIIRAMNVATSLCNSYCSLMDTYFISHELGFNGMPFYGPGTWTIDPKGSLVLYSLFPKNSLEQFGLDNLAGHMDKYLSDFKKDIQMFTISVPKDEVLMVMNPGSKSMHIKVSSN